MYGSLYNIIWRKVRTLFISSQWHEEAESRVLILPFFFVHSCSTSAHVHLIIWRSCSSFMWATLFCVFLQIYSAQSRLKNVCVTVDFSDRVTKINFLLFLSVETSWVEIKLNWLCLHYLILVNEFYNLLNHVMKMLKIF